MRSKGNKKAFSLAEIMIVMLLLTILFAVMAPLFTKKMIKDKGSVWNWVDTHSTFSAYFDGDNTDSHNLFSPAYFGTTPTDMTSSDYSPFSKIIIRSNVLNGKVQKQIHFRHGYNKLNDSLSSKVDKSINQLGNNAGTMLLDTKNILVGGSYDHLYANGSISQSFEKTDGTRINRKFSLKPQNNISFGNNSLNTLHRYSNARRRYNLASIHESVANGIIAIGYNAGSNDSLYVLNPIYYLDDLNKFSYDYTDNIYIGYNAGYIGRYTENGVTPFPNKYDPAFYSPLFPGGNIAPNIIGQTIIGSNAGLNNYGNLNTIIGSNAGKNFRGQNNVFIGSNAGAFNEFIRGDNRISKQTNYNDYKSNENQYSKVDNNVAIGYNALHSLVSSPSETPGGLPMSGDVFYAYSSDNNVTIGGLLYENPYRVNYNRHDNNIAIGANALANLETGFNNVAIGANACSKLKYSANKICIGANSGPDEGRTSSYLDVLDSNFSDYKYFYDLEQRIYIGGKPEHFGGDAILEIHNLQPKVNIVHVGSSGETSPLVEFGSLFNSPSALANEPSVVRSDATTIINGNLVVNGNVFFTVGDYLNNFQYVAMAEEGSTAAGYHPQWAAERFLGGNNSDDSDVICARGPLTYTFGGEYDDSGVFKEFSYTTSSGGTSYVSCPKLYYDSENSYKLVSPSDRRLKNIGSRNKAGLAEISKLKVFNFIFKDDENKTPHVGVIAQDLMKIFPNSVMTNEKGFLTIKLDEMFYAAINAIKELDKKLIVLAKRAFKVETTITKLETENAVLKSQVESLTLRVNKIKASRGL